MGRRGPAPEPAASKLARGETRPSRLNRMEPLPRHAPPRPPKGLSDRAKEVWRRVLRDAPPNLIMAADADVLRIFCDAVVLYEDAIGTVMRIGLVVRGRHGELVKNPVLMPMRDQREAIRILSRELGLSPAARAGLQVAVGSSPGLDIDAEIGPPPRLLVVGGGDD